MAKRRKAKTRRTSVESASTVVAAASPDVVEPEVEPEAPKLRDSTELPTKAIAFDFGPPMGTMETRYHDIYREGNRLVLAWNVDCVNASKYKPSPMETPLKVIVGQEREEYTVYSLGIEFTDEAAGRFYVVLLIDMRTTQNGQDGSG